MALLSPNATICVNRGVKICSLSSRRGQDKILWVLVEGLGFHSHVYNSIAAVVNITTRAPDRLKEQSIMLFSATMLQNAIGGGTVACLNGVNFRLPG